FEGKNSRFFYRLAFWRTLLGIKFNIEQLYLADEMYKGKGKHFTIRVGKPIPYTTFDQSRSPQEWAEWVKNIVYSL
ncbi:MAG: glycerol acyltransferase, partial [Paludibacteraceae bacterium]|nr:glycerol acyltransferase [Paludibacteraceae bacterium]